ncbi:MAG: hypothetical protein MZW92_38470 [Comamonadaceae bacterium]|nr:hypothetical protein [Comamonadaceae bacterium]
MSQLLINQYLGELDRICARRAAARASRCCARPSRTCSRAGAGSTTWSSFPSTSSTPRPRTRRYVDGALLHELRVPFGYWEAKDEEDDLDEEIACKFRRGYPQDNIIFEDSAPGRADPAPRRR